MDTLAKKLINDHRNPIVKADLPGSKLFLKSSTQEEIEFIKKHQTNLESVLSYDRTERRCGRSQAIWLPEYNLAKVTKTIKTINNFGYQDKSGSYLYPEETLFLMETNRLEVTLNGIPLSIQKSYDVLLKSSKCDLNKYRVYKKLVLQGYKLLRRSELLRRLSKTEKNSASMDKSACGVVEHTDFNKKRAFEESSMLSSKKRKSDTGTHSTELQMEYIRSVFEKLQRNAPRQYNSRITCEENPQYYVFLPNNKSRCDYDFHLYIVKDSILKTQNGSAIPSILAVCSEGNISFYKYSTVKLPFV